ncbi:MAG TPA: ABC transporter ATP-binding protein [Rhodospirillales bacterium]|nr:ABC transporter ATP-binding protein [Rhodospirillales bacterium]HIA82917.1 ABC transporter ATP-binding protein [Rhodospirillales bacterium]HIB20761.1 ABC transporter ATP-binding protein [Rhodospirillales bacterium]HIC60966.1 ABC transporter ATP-binding protein [Rhodospirillales bacterium]HIN77148.1 ABC transporter ATP-binding protein [Rhodospirillales bacterium]|tara:strand:- start:1233 stop:1958 length:726 start_codon:yes stop_codon:yes gene_type:complete
MSTILEVSGVSKAFGSLKVIDGFDFELAEGEALGIIGPNGAGKSTLFNLITGSLKPNSGSIRFEGVDITQFPAYRRCRLGIGRSYQIPHPFKGMTVFENLLVGAAFGKNQSEVQSYDACARILDLTGLLEKSNVLAGQLTLLERKRLELARALATSPRALLLDEIAGGLTEPEIQELIETISFIRSENISVIWIEHIVHALMSVVDRLIVINFGKKLEDGDPETVIKSPEVQEVYMGIGIE